MVPSVIPKGLRITVSKFRCKRQIPERKGATRGGTGFPQQRIAVFVDGDFWHGRDRERRQERLGSGNNGAYWIAKIGYNRERDGRNNALLAQLGWRVVRLWETDVLQDPERAASQVAGLVTARR